MASRAVSTPRRVAAAEVAKFAAVGAAAYVITVALSNLLRFGPPRTGPVTALAAAMTAAATFSYFANRHWTWRHKHRQGLGREYVMFLLLSAIGFGLTEFPLVVSEYVLLWHSPLAYNVAGNAVGTGLGTIWRFWSFKRWIFLEPASYPRDAVGGVGSSRGSARGSVRPGKGSVTA